jgi:hypothetical protein
VSLFSKVLHGPVCSVCTDGDARQQLARYQICMTSKVTPGSDLFQLIGELPLLNLRCGQGYLTHDGDYKHEEKRECIYAPYNILGPISLAVLGLASALRSRSGILVGGVYITPMMLVIYLRSVGNLLGSCILSFFDGVDPQNVPKASALLTHLHQASQLPSLSSRPEHKPFILLGEVLGSFVLPYTTPTMLLAEQITSLVKCSHLLFALYRIDGTQFLPGQLIYDIQALIKNAVFCVAKAQIIDASCPFYLLQTGTGQLETRFGTCRTTTSDCNSDILQMCKHAASAQHINGIFSEHPSGNRAPYRLSLDGKSGVDHTNPAPWVGDVTVGNIDLRACWICG